MKALRKCAGKENGGSRRGRPVGDHETKRGAFLNAGIKVIAEQGFAGASLRKVAERAGHTTGAIAHYFENKEQLFAAIVEALFDQFDAMLGAAPENETILRRFRRWLEMSDSSVWVAGFQMLARARLDPALAAIYQQHHARYRRIAVVRIEQEQRAGLIRNDIPADLLADQIGALADGWSMMLPIERERFGPEHVERLLDALILQLSPPRR